MMAGPFLTSPYWDDAAAWDGLRMWSEADILSAEGTAAPSLSAALTTAIALGANLRARTALVARISSPLPPVRQVEDPRFVYAHRHETLDALVWRVRGIGSGAVERVLAANPGLAAIGPHLPEGLPVLIPDVAAARSPNIDLIQLWD